MEDLNEFHVRLSELFMSLLNFYHVTVTGQSQQKADISSIFACNLLEIYILSATGCQPQNHGRTNLWALR